MVQLTLDQYFHSFRTPAGPASRVTFLDLPFALRRRVYLNAGLLSNSTVYLNYIPSSSDHCDLEYGGDLEQWPMEETISARGFSLSHFLDGYLPWPQICLDRHCLCLEQHSSNEPQCKCNALPYQLLYVSKAVAKEVFTIFYSENDFSVYRTALGGLSSLSRLPPKALAHMRSLSICLNFYDEQNRWSRDFGPDCGGSCHIACGMSKTERLLSSTKRRHERGVLREWQKLCKLLKSEIKPNYLKLFLVCDVADVEIAEEIIQPLLQLPTLQECALRLGSHYLHSGPDCSQLLTELARRTIDKVTGRTIQLNFRYEDLPKEIQIRILGFTELVTHCDLVWAFNTDVARQIKSPYHEFRAFPSDCSAWTSSLCCRNCSPNSEPCACWSGQSAFSTTCTCWKFPLSLFLVDHDMRKDAEFIFYSKNHFLLNPRRWNNSTHLEIYNFLKHLPRNGRRYIRAITWTLSDLNQGGGYLEPNYPTYSEWTAAISMLAHDVLPGRLSLTIDPQFDLQSILWSHGSEYMDVPDDCGTAEAERTWTVCERVADSLSGNNHLKNLFIHFVWPFEKHKDSMPRDRGAVLEKRVLGEEFDGRARGKFERRCSGNKYRCTLNVEGICVVCQST